MVSWLGSKLTYMQTMGQRIRVRREKLNLSRRELAERLGVTEQLIGQWERDVVKNIRPNNLMRMAELFQVSYKYLIRGTSFDPAFRSQTQATTIRLLGNSTGTTGELIARHWDSLAPETRYVLYMVARADLGDLIERRGFGALDDAPEVDRRRQIPK